MDSTTVKDKIIKIIAETLKTTEEDVQNTPVLDELGIDSVYFIEIVLHIEDKFGIQFEEDMLVYSKFPDLDTLVKYVLQLTE